MFNSTYLCTLPRVSPLYPYSSLPRSNCIVRFLIMFCRCRCASELKDCDVRCKSQYLNPPIPPIAHLVLLLVLSVCLTPPPSPVVMFARWCCPFLSLSNVHFKHNGESLQGVGESKKGVQHDLPSSSMPPGKQTCFL